MTSLVIVAGGLGSRLAPMTNCIPKFLVNIGKNTGYVQMIRYWMKQMNLKEQYSLEKDVLTVIVNKEYAPLTKAYHEMYFPDIPLTIKTVSSANGSADAILSTCSHLANKDVLFTWCDVLPDCDLPKTIFSYEDGEVIHFETNVIFTNYNNSCRYGLIPVNGFGDVLPIQDPNQRGGCFGLYYINNFRTNITYNDGDDFIDVISQYGRIREYHLESIIDFGDAPKLARVQDKADEAREFNSVKIVGDFILKESANEQGKGIMAKEILWYKDLGEYTKNKERPAVPKAWIADNNSGMFLERINGVPIWKAWGGLSDVDRHYVLSQHIKAEDDLYKLKTKEVPLLEALEDIRIESRIKLITRFNEIEEVIKSFGNIEYVNGYKLKETNVRKTIDDLSSKIVKYYSEKGAESGTLEYGFIHGDLQFSNSLVNLETLKVSVIDPRGYFGGTIGLGLQDYDIGKLLYAICGYDGFNSSRTFGLQKIKDGEICFNIDAVSSDGIKDILTSHFKPIHYMWLAVNFLGLAQYIKNDPVKSVCAHYYGMYLAEYALDL
jgi:hypothetical protein